MKMHHISIEFFKRYLLFLLRSALIFTKYLCESMANIKAAIFANNMGTPSGFSAIEQGPKFEETNLLVNYLPFDLQENELYMMFIGFGKLEHVKIIRDAMTGNSQCYGFVKYRNSKDAKMALSLMNGRHVHGKNLKVSVARPSSEEIKHTNLYVANLPVDYDAAMVREMFERFGKILDLKLLKDRYTRQSRGIAFVRYDLRASVDQAVMALNGFRLEIGHPPLQVREARRPKDFEFPNAMIPGHGLPVAQASTDTSMESLKQEIKIGNSEVDSPTAPSKFLQSIGCNAITSSLRRSLNNTLVKFNVHNGRRVVIPALPIKTEPDELAVPKEISPKLASDCSICLSQSGLSGKRFETAKSLKKKQFRRAKFYPACKPKQSDTQNN